MYKTAMKILSRIEEHGKRAYIVGGYPRDLYLNRPSIDIDICTEATPKQLKEIFNDSMLPTVQYGCVTVVCNHIRFEITTFRKEMKYENHRVPIKMKYIQDLKSDLLRRDFTINTLVIDKEGRLLDLLDSKKDLDGRIVRMVGNPKKRLKEDSLRILRAIRFATILGFTLDENLKIYIKKYGYLLKKLSYERKKEELDKIFSSTNIEYGISLLRELGLDRSLELAHLDSLTVTTSGIGIWAQVGALEHYHFSAYEKDTILTIQKLLDCDLSDPDILYQYGLYLVSLAGEIKGISRREITEKYNELPIKSSKEIALSAPEICELLCRKPGNFLKVILKDLEKQILHQSLPNQTEVLKEYVVRTYF